MYQLFKILVIHFLVSLFICWFTDNKKVKSGNAHEKDIHINWDQSTLRRVSSTTLQANYSGYGRMIQLTDTSLLAVYEADGSIVAVKSTDLGNTWEEAVVIARRAEGVSMSVPSVLLLNDQKILVCYNARPYKVSPSRKFSILVKQSSDGGLSWNTERLVYEAGYQFENGCWEPAAIQLPNGEIQLYFANEGPYTSSDEQNISMLRSFDMGDTWTTQPTIVSFRPGKRDGMPVPLVLKNGKEVAVAIEDNAVNTFKPYVIKNSLKESWTKTVGAKSPNRSYALSSRIADEIYAGAPYIVKLSTGETLLSYQGTEGRTNSMNFADMKVAIGNDEAQEFRNKSIPFVIPGNKSCLWNSLTVLSDDTVIAVTSTNAYSAKREIWMIKGKVMR